MYILFYMYSLLLLTIYILIYYFIVYKKTKHLDLTKETLNMFKTDKPTSIYIVLFYIVLVAALINYIFFTDFFKFTSFDVLGLILIVFSGLIEYSAIISLKENYYPQTGKEKKLITTGIYSLVRHPIYLSGVFLGFGIVSLFAKNFFYIYFICITAIIVYKVESEEKYLTKRFVNYKIYKKNTYKLIPYIY